ncbi:MAG: RNA-binding domain-containing protein [Candidatus Bathyarchaeia archaeon]|nr:hypothetical protein [Candidatus Bathyarchaeota archaeon]
MSELDLKVEAELSLTEDEEKVRLAVSNLFPQIKLNLIEVDDVHKKLVGEGRGFEGLLRLKELLHRERIRAAALNILSSSIHENYLTIHFNKQAAYAGHISFATEPGESALGPITVYIRSEDPRKIIEWLVETS